MVARSDTLMHDWRGTDEADFGLDILAVLSLWYQSEGLSFCLDLLFRRWLISRVCGCMCPSCPASAASSTASTFASISVAVVSLRLFAILTFAWRSVSSSTSSTAIVPAAIGRLVVL